MKEIITEIKALLDREIPSLECVLAEDRVIRIEPVNIEVGGISIEEYFDDEAIVYLGRFTHCHIGCYENYTNDQMVESISTEVVNLIKDLINDEIILWARKRSGGFYKKGEKPNSKSLFGKQYEEWVWSGRVSS